MSMNSSFIYGYGFPCDWTEEHFLAFIKNHKETFCQSKAEEKQYQELLECTENTDTQNEFDLDEFFDKYECETNGMQGTGAVVTNIMHRETGIGFFFMELQMTLVIQKPPLYFRNSYHGYSMILNEI